MTRSRLLRVVLRVAPFLVLSLVLLTAGACRREGAQEAPQGATEDVETTTTVTVTTAVAARATIRASVHATGVVTPAPGAELIVVAPEAARVAEIPHAAGDRVRRGDLLVRFEIPSTTAEVEKQQAEVTRAEAGLTSATAAQARARGLFDRGVAARREVEDAARAVADAEAAVSQARSALTAARTVAQRATVRATFDGVVVKRSHNPGDLVEASAGDPVLRVVDTARLEVVAAVPLSDAPLVRVGATARLRDATAGAAAGAADAKLTVISGATAVEPGTATVPVRLTLKGGARLPVGTPVQLEIAATEHRDAIGVPSGAVVREGDDTALFVVTDGKAHRRPVQLGLTDGAMVEIVSGISIGDHVIVDGQAGLPDGAPVKEAAGQ